MTKKGKIFLWSTLGALVLAIVVAIVCANSLLTRVANRQLRKQLALYDNLTLSYDQLRIRLLEGNIAVSGLDAQMLLVDSLRHDTLKQHIAADCIEVKGINWLRLRKRQLSLRAIEINSPSALLILPSPAKQASPKTTPADLPALTDTVIANRLQLLSAISIDKLNLTNGSISLSNAADQLTFSTDSLCLSCRDLNFNIADSTFCLNDSVYELNLSNIRLLTPDGLTRLTLGRLTANGQDGFCASRLRALNTCPREQLARRQGKVPVTWIDTQIEQVSSSKFNPLRQLSRRSIDIDTISVKGQSVQLYRDTQYPPKEPYPMPQEAILNIPIPVRVAHLLLTMPKAAIAVTDDGTHVGNMQVSDIRAQAQGFSNKPGSTLNADASCSLAGGKAVANLTLTNDHPCSFTFSCKSSDMKAQHMNDFIQPFSGASARGNIHSLTLHTKGDAKTSESHFCMIYDSLTAHIDENNAPIAALAKAAGVINFFAPAIMQHSNPRHKGSTPFVCKSTATRNTREDFAMYLLAEPLIDGMMHTLLPDGIYNIVSNTMKQMRMKESKNKDKDKDKIKDKAKNKKKKTNG